MIRNNKDFFDQSLGEIKLLRYLNALDPHDAHHVLRMRDFFYFRHAPRSHQGRGQGLSGCELDGSCLCRCTCVCSCSRGARLSLRARLMRARLALCAAAACVRVPACECREHLFIVCELLRDNLYELYKFFKQHGPPLPPHEPSLHALGGSREGGRAGGLARYFTVPRVLSVARQVLTALAFVHSHCLVHCDLKVASPVTLFSCSRAVVRSRCCAGLAEGGRW